MPVFTWGGWCRGGCPRGIGSALHRRSAPQISPVFGVSCPVTAQRVGATVVVSVLGDPIAHARGLIEHWNFFSLFEMFAISCVFSSPYWCNVTQLLFFYFSTTHGLGHHHTTQNSLHPLKKQPPGPASFSLNIWAWSGTLRRPACELATKGPAGQGEGPSSATGRC